MCSNLIWTPIHSTVFHVVWRAFHASVAPYRTFHYTSIDIYAFYIPLSVHLLPTAHHEATNYAVSFNILPLPPQYVPPPPLHSLFTYIPNLILVAPNEIRILTSKPNARRKYNSTHFAFYVSMSTTVPEPWLCTRTPCLSLWRKVAITHTAWFAMQRTFSLSTTLIAAIRQEISAPVTPQHQSLCPCNVKSPFFVTQYVVS